MKNLTPLKLNEISKNGDSPFERTLREKLYFLQ